MAEAGDDATGTRFEWNAFMLAGDPASGRYIVDARDLAGGRAIRARTDTYFAGFPNAAEQQPAPSARTISASTRRAGFG